MMKHLNMTDLVEKLAVTSNLNDQELFELIENHNEETARLLFQKARDITIASYGRDIYIRGLIEFTNYCRNDCYYCGIRNGNTQAQRYRLTKQDILSCCDSGYDLGFRTFVLQGGEDPYFTDERVEDIIISIKKQHPQCAITLSIGERSEESYHRLYEAGADRYLLRHETADADHYGKLHPSSMTHAHRMSCLNQLKEIGYQTGCGFMTGSPGQTTACLVKDLRFLKDFSPHMVGIGPFLPHRDTPFAAQPAGSLSLTLYLLAITRLLLPKTLLPATTALGTLSEDGRERGILAGANVVMPNLSPLHVRRKYMLYDKKRFMGDEAAESVSKLQKQMNKIGYSLVTARGDSKVV